MGSIIIAMCFTCGLFIYNVTIAKDEQLLKQSWGVRLFVFCFTLLTFLGSLFLPAFLVTGLLGGVSFLFPESISSSSFLDYLHLSVITCFAMYLYELFVETPLKIVCEKLQIPVGFLLSMEIVAETTLLLCLSSLWVTEVSLTLHGVLLVSGCHTAARHVMNQWAKTK